MSARESLPGPIAPIAPIAQLDPERVFALIDRVLPFEVCLYHQVLPIEIQGDRIVLGVVSATADLSYVQRMLAHLHYQLVYQPIELAAQQQLLSAFLSHDYHRKAGGYVEPNASLQPPPTPIEPADSDQQPASDTTHSSSLGHGTLSAGTDHDGTDTGFYPSIEVSDCLVALQPSAAMPDTELADLAELAAGSTDRADSPAATPPDVLETVVNLPPTIHSSVALPSRGPQGPQPDPIAFSDWNSEDWDSDDPSPESPQTITDTVIAPPPSPASGHPDPLKQSQKGELGKQPHSPSPTPDRAPERPMDTFTDYAVVTTSDLGAEMVSLSTDLPAELAQLEQALVQALERPTSAARAIVPSASEIEAVWGSPTVSAPLEWVDLNPSPLVLHTRYDDRPLSELGGLPPRSLMQELLQRAIEGGIGRLYFDRPEPDRARILCSRDGILQAALDPLPPSTFQGVIDELKLLANLPLLPPVGKARQVEIERIYRSELLLLRLRIAPGRLGEEATLQVLRGAALKFHQRQQLAKLSQDAIDLTRQLQKKLAEMQVRASLSQDFNPRSQDLAQLQVAVQRLVERLAGWRS